MPRGWRRLAHTSDLKLEFTAPGLVDLFRVAAEGLFASMLDREAVRSRERHELALEAEDRDALFLDWLRELLFLFETRGFALRRVESITLAPDGTGLHAEFTGEPFDPARHRPKLEVKSPTYHDYRLERMPEGWRAVVLFDV